MLLHCCTTFLRWQCVEITWGELEYMDYTLGIIIPIKSEITSFSSYFLLYHNELISYDAVGNAGTEYFLLHLYWLTRQCADSLAIPHSPLPTLFSFQKPFNIFADNLLRICFHSSLSACTRPPFSTNNATPSESNDTTKKRPNIYLRWFMQHIEVGEVFRDDVLCSKIQNCAIKNILVGNILNTLCIALKLRISIYLSLV